MKEILPTIILFVIFAFGYFITDRFGRFADKNYRGFRDPQELRDPQAFQDRQGLQDMLDPADRGSSSESGEMSRQESPEKVCPRPAVFSDCEEYDVLICRRIDPGIVEYLREKGCKVGFSVRQQDTA